MSFLEPKRVSAGELIGGAFGELAENRREVLIYLGAFGVVALASFPVARAVPPLAGLASLALFVGYFLAQYLLYRTLLRRAGQVIVDDRIRIFRFMAMAVVIGLVVGFASSLFLIPGILIAARWIMAPCYLVITNRGLFAALGDSWSASKGNTLSLSLAFTALFLIFMVLSTVLGSVDGILPDALGPNPLAGLGFHFLPLLLMGLSVTAFRRLNGEGHELSAVFA
jgi:hypothetical protein